MSYCPTLHICLTERVKDVPTLSFPLELVHCTFYTPPCIYTVLGVKHVPAFGIPLNQVSVLLYSPLQLYLTY